MMKFYYALYIIKETEKCLVVLASFYEVKSLENFHRYVNGNFLFVVTGDKGEPCDECCYGLPGPQGLPGI